MNEKEETLSLAEQGLPDAQFVVGCWYLVGHEGYLKDDTKACEWFLKAANQGHWDAQHNLAHSYENGEGVELNNEKAFQYYLNNARLWWAPSQYNLGKFYEEGRGTEKNDEKAFKWYLQSAEQGIDIAQFFAGSSYLQGRGVASNQIEGLKWLLIASEQDNVSANEALQKLTIGPDLMSAAKKKVEQRRELKEHQKYILNVLFPMLTNALIKSGDLKHDKYSVDGRVEEVFKRWLDTYLMKKDNFTDLSNLVKEKNETIQISAIINITNNFGKDIKSS